MTGNSLRPPAETSPGRKLTGLASEVGILERERAFSSAAVVNKTVIENSGSSEAQIAQINAYLAAHKLTVKDISTGEVLDVVEIEFDGATVSNIGSGQAKVTITGGSGSTGTPGLRVVAPPTLAGLTQVNAGAATFHQNADGSISAMQAPSGNSYALLLASVTAPYEFIVGFYLRLRNAGFQQLSVVARNSTSGKFVNLAVFDNAGAFSFQAGKWDSPTTPNSNYVTSNGLSYQVSPMFLRVKDDGTNRTVGWSCDGYYFEDFSSVATGDFITVDQVGIGLNCVSASNPVAMSVFSWIV